MLKVKVNTEVAVYNTILTTTCQATQWHNSEGILYVRHIQRNCISNQV